MIEVLDDNLGYGQSGLIDIFISLARSSSGTFVCRSHVVCCLGVIYKIEVAITTVKIGSTDTQVVPTAIINLRGNTYLR